MLKKLKHGFVALGLTLSLLAASPLPAFAASAVDNACNANPSSVICEQTKGAKGKTDTFVQNIISTLLFAVGAISIIMIIVGGLRYVLSDGDSNKISNAKNTVLYAIVGLVISMLAYAIVNFVVARFI